MAALKKAFTAQHPLSATFEFTMADSAINTGGASANFNAAGAGVFDVIALPAGGVMVGGSVAVEVVSNDATTATISVGDSGVANRYVNAANLKAVATTLFTLTGFKHAGEELRITITNGTGGATTGTVRVTALFIIDGRIDAALN